jgi:hypothetical protein
MAIKFHPLSEWPEDMLKLAHHAFDDTSWERGHMACDYDRTGCVLDNPRK